jgi:hypothetical protein
VCALVVLPYCSALLSLLPSLWGLWGERLYEKVLHPMLPTAPTMGAKGTL